MSKRIEDAIALGLSLGFMLLILLVAGIILASCASKPPARTWNNPGIGFYGR